jgi:hypothetical protein
MDRDWHHYNTYEITDVNEGSTGLFPSVYESISYCNMAISLANSSTELSDAEKTDIIANARLLRGWFYFNLWINYRNVPWVSEENLQEARVPNTDENGDYIDISDNILADFTYAAENLPESPSVKSYANNWAAKVFKAKTLVFKGNYIELDGGDGSSQFNDAKDLFDDIIANGQNSFGVKYALNSNYKSNFDPENKNSCESIFAKQAANIEAYPALANGDLTFLFYLAPLMRFGFCYDALMPSQWYVDHYRVDENGLPYLDMYATNDYSIDDGSTSTVPFADYEVDQVNPVDPRLDINVLRYGVDHNGWGKAPKNVWNDFSFFWGNYREKKFIVTPEQVSEHLVLVGNTSLDMNVDVLTFRDVLLLAAEVEARVGDLATAQGYVNQIRNRIKNDDTDWAMEVDTAGVYSGNYAANYSVEPYPDGHVAFSTKDNALDAILYERTLELGLEGHRFYDLVRFGKDEEEIPAYIASAVATGRDFMSIAAYDTHKRLMPIPAIALSNSQKDGVQTIKQNPGY